MGDGSCAAEPRAQADATLPVECDSCADAADVLAARLAEHGVAPHLAAALDAVDAALRLYGPERLLVSFNGGKDATVLLHLARAAYSRAGAGTPRCVYWHDADCFSEVHAFVEATVKRYQLPLVRYDCSFADGMRDAVDRLGVAAVFLGTRGVDPNGAGAQTFQPSSRGWPAFMRVNPVLRWSYGDVWAFLRGQGLAYCALYDRGYTSLGNVRNTRPNPALLRADGSYDAAHTLQLPSLERGGRGATQPAQPGVGLVFLDVQPQLAAELCALAQQCSGGSARAVSIPSELEPQLQALAQQASSCAGT